MKKLLPGPYTFILPAAKMIPKKLLSKRQTVGIRIPDHPITLTLVAELGHPISSISVTNRKGDIIADPNEIKSLFGTQVDLMLSSGHLNGIPSSVIDFSESEPQIIRQGAGDLSYFA
jgi:tRNA threonylcarbamoyl adenosine modification protein (Sua5/YciO/YrdC/YwlC family)